MLLSSIRRHAAAAPNVIPHATSTGHTSSDVSEAIRYSEESRTKCIGLTIETRPDYCLGPHLSDMLSYGCTRLEIGLQVGRGAGRVVSGFLALYVLPHQVQV